jgi:hypothetical protein
MPQSISSTSPDARASHGGGLAFFQLPEVSKSEYQLLELTIQLAAMRYGEAADIERRAWAMWLEGCDAGYTYAATDDLLKHAMLAEQIRKEAQAELDTAKAMLLSLQS